MAPHAHATTTVVLGGGFGGIAAANELRQRLPHSHDVVLVDRSERFHIGSGLTWIMLGERSYEQVSQSRTALLAPGVRFLQADIQALDLARWTVTAGAETLGWDYLVIALGADLNPGAVPGLAEATHTFYTAEGAQRLRAALADFAGGDVVLLIPKLPYKCPAAPYEAAMLLQRQWEQRGLLGKMRLAIYTVEAAPVGTAGPAMGQFVRDALAQRGIAFYPQRKTVRIDGVARQIDFEDGGSARYDLLITIPPHEAPPAVRDAQLLNEAGWIAVDAQTLQVKAEHAPDCIYAVGDVTTVALPGRYRPDMALALPKAGVFAEAEGRVVAQQIAARIEARSDGAAFDGKGYCYLEIGGRRAVKVNGAFFALPQPEIEPPVADEARYLDKLEWVERHLQPLPLYR